MHIFLYNVQTTENLSKLTEEIQKGQKSKETIVQGHLALKVHRKTGSQDRHVWYDFWRPGRGLHSGAQKSRNRRPGHSCFNQKLDKTQRPWKSICKIKYTISSKWLNTCFTLSDKRVTYPPQAWWKMMEEGSQACMHSLKEWRFTGAPPPSRVNGAGSEPVDTNAKFFLFWMWPHVGSDRNRWNRLGQR